MESEVLTMNDSYHRLFEPLAFKHGPQLKNRFAMCPMVVFAANEDGTPSQEDLDYFRRRNQFGDLLLTGAITISEHIKGHPQQLSIASDAAIPAFAELAAVMKAHGGKAVAQIQHPGREAAHGYKQTGKAYAPSSIRFPFLPYQVTELNDDEIWGIIEAFGLAARRLMQAGFDGVEIHGANHYLIQQFFSAYSNKREDDWGGTLAKRMNFAKEATKAVIKAARAENPQAIIGYRISPEEIHGETVGYTLDEALLLIDWLANMNLDFLDVSSAGSGNFSSNAYKAFPRISAQQGAINTIIRTLLNNRLPLVISGTIRSAEEALDALNYGDIIAMGVAALSDPDFKAKIAAGKEQQINMNVAGRLADLRLPSGLIAVYKQGVALPQVEGLLTG